MTAKTAGAEPTQATGSLAQALAAFQLELPRLGKSSTADAGTYKYRYADLAEVSTLVLPLLAKQGLSFSSKPTIDESGRFVLAYVLRHTSGDEDSGSYPLPTASPQQVGSAITYARRYVLCAVTGIAPDEDDDGQAAAQTSVKAQRYWDPVEQDVLRTGWEAEIADAKTAEDIAAIGQRVLKSTDLSPNTVAHLRNAAATRKAELNGAAT
jgi:hypothetical protein